MLVFPTLGIKHLGGICHNARCLLEPAAEGRWSPSIPNSAGCPVRSDQWSTMEMHVSLNHSFLAGAPVIWTAVEGKLLGSGGTCRRESHASTELPSLTFRTVVQLFALQQSLKFCRITWESALSSLPRGTWIQPSYVRAEMQASRFIYRLFAQWLGESVAVPCDFRAHHCSANRLPRSKMLLLTFLPYHHQDILNWAVLGCHSSSIHETLLSASRIFVYKTQGLS